MMQGKRPLGHVGKPERLNFHFDDMFHAFMTVFVIITLDDWTDIMFPLMSSSFLLLLHYIVLPGISESKQRPVSNSAAHNLGFLPLFIAWQHTAGPHPFV
eukprot:1160568-Pelagomonas_calceolata.AAC.19